MLVNSFNGLAQLNLYIMFSYCSFSGPGLQGRLFDGAQGQGEAEGEESGTGEQI